MRAGIAHVLMYVGLGRAEFARGVSLPLLLPLMVVRVLRRRRVLLEPRGKKLFGMQVCKTELNVADDMPGLSFLGTQGFRLFF